MVGPSESEALSGEARPALAVEGVLNPNLVVEDYPGLFEALLDVGCRYL